MANLLFDESASNSDASQGYAWWFSGDTFEKAAAEDAADADAEPVDAK